MLRLALHHPLHGALPRPLLRPIVSIYSTSSTSSSSPPPIASQDNGFARGRTIYRVLPSDSEQKFHVEKTGRSLERWTQKANSLKNAPTSIAAVQRTGTWIYDVLWDLFLPKDARSSLTKDYFPYAKWTFVGSVASCAASVLSMQSLLFAIGLGAGAIPTAAAVNWVLKDGLGQFGGVLFASIVNNRYDADPKRWRLASSVALDVSVLGEILTPLAPGSFLAIASLANVAKNVAWLSASATRAGFHNSFAIRENLADVTAKAGSQAIASSIFGTGLGILISQWTGASTLNVVAAFSVLSSLHMISTYKSVDCVQLRTLNCQRLHLVATHFLRSPPDAREIPSLKTVSEREVFIPTMISGYQTLHDKSVIHEDATLDQISHGSPKVLAHLKEFYGAEKYLLNLKLEKNGPHRIDLALDENASSLDALLAHLHGVLIQVALEDTATPPVDAWELVEEKFHKAAALNDEFISRLEESKWHTDNLLVEEKNSRYKWLA
ncbi:Protein root UVB sensitive 1 [Phytophthora citrophthora]|uniref:Protein root UVB sensitive 1 n=1 Tax=Phytophthora citrophthora TaxID=4793 RepID=A0AAD9GU96_9STRA|nr:Protein root UVB sensitive 1 [Phytophthora citrophthora]